MQELTAVQYKIILLRYQCSAKGFGKFSPKIAYCCPQHFVVVSFKADKAVDGVQLVSAFLIRSAC